MFNMISVSYTHYNLHVQLTIHLLFYPTTVSTTTPHQNNSIPLWYLPFLPYFGQNLSTSGCSPTGYILYNAWVAGTVWWTQTCFSRLLIFFLVSPSTIYMTTWPQKYKKNLSCLSPKHIFISRRLLKEGKSCSSLPSFLMQSWCGCPARSSSAGKHAAGSRASAQRASTERGGTPHHHQQGWTTKC